MKHSERFDASLTAEGRYRLLVESISDYAIYMLEPDGTVANWNAGAQRFKGYTADEIVGQNFSRFYTEEDRAAGLPQRNLKLAAKEGRFEEEGWRVRKDGTMFWASVVIDRILGPSGELVGFAKITRDLTERKRQQEQLRRSEEQFSLLVKGVTDYALYMLDPDGHVASWNAGAERIKGFTEDEIIGQHFSRFYSEADRLAGEPETNLRIARENGRVEREGWRCRKDGSRFYAHVIIDAVHDGEGSFVGFAKVTRDITERRQAQEQLDKAKEALFQSQKMEAIGQLTGGIAHDFNNLLSAVLGSLEIATKRMSYDPRVAPFIENAVQGAHRGAALTQRMLAFARRQQLETQPVDVLATVRGMGDLLERALGPSVFVSTRFPLSLPHVQADPAQLESALLNLAVNARDSMPSGGPIIIAAAVQTVGERGHRSLAPGQYVVLSVSDKGEGMDEFTLSKAAEPFFTTKGVGKGTGLGLSMVHGMAEQSGGALILSSRKGKGTTAELWLPLAVQSDSQEVAPVGSTSTNVSGARVLVVDDDPLVLFNTVAMLEDMGHQVTEAVCAKDALAILSREQVDVVVTDYAMPQMSGGELAAEIAAKWPRVRIVIATGYAELEEGVAETYEVLNKPFAVQDLKDVLGRVLN